MIWILGGIGRVVGREVAEEAVGRIVAGRTTEDLFAREEIARRIGKASYDSLINKLREIQDERMVNDARKKETNWKKTNRLTQECNLSSKIADIFGCKRYLYFHSSV